MLLLYIVGCSGGAGPTDKSIAHDTDPLDDTAPTPDDTDTDTGTTSWPAGATILDHVTVVDARGGRDDQAVIVVSDLIWDVRPSTPDRWPADATVVDLTGRFLTPGLIDAHVHLFHSGSTGWVGDTLEDNLRAQLSWGVVGVADLGSPVAIFDLRDRIAAGEITGPRIWATGPFLTATGSHPCETVNDAQLCLFVDAPGADAAAMVQETLSRADGLKVALADADFTPWPTPRLDLGDLATIIAAAAGRPVWAHVDEPDDVADAQAAGVAVMAHPIFSTAAGTPYPDVTTTSTWGAFSGALSVLDGSLLNDEDLRATPAAVRTAWAALEGRSELFDPDWLTGSAAWSAATEANLTAMAADGRVVLAGSDAGYWFVPHGVGLHRELDALAAAGLSPLEALAAATTLPASALGWDDLGWIEPGYRADLLVLTADPRENVRALRAIEAVWLGGTPLAEAAPLLQTPGRGDADAFCLSAADCDPEMTGRTCDRVDHACRAACPVAYAVQDAVCGAGGFCMPVDALASTTDATCHPGDACDLYAQDCAPAAYGEGCVPLDLDTNVCVTAGPRRAGQTCSQTEATRACEQGAFCSSVDLRCYTLCDPDASTPDCTCIPQRVGGTVWFGICR